MNTIDKLFESDDILYHYTKTQTAYEHILHTNTLRLSDRKNSNDPLESFTERMIPRSSFGHLDTQKATENDAKIISQFIKENSQKAKQLCFCKNNNTIERQFNSIFPAEYFGFLKPRMWDQYGDSYKGVCLVFDKKVLKENNSDTYSDDVQYINYEQFHKNHISIDLNRLYSLGIDDYCKQTLEIIKGMSFLKHKDYSGENEYRFISFSESETFMDIGNSLKAIIISRKNLSDFARKWFVQYTNSRGIKLFYIDWNHHGCSILSNEQEDKHFKSVSEMVSRIKVK